MTEGTVELYRNAFGEIEQVKVGEEELRKPTLEEIAIYDEAVNGTFVDGR